jgi:hypothetical protein
VLHLDPSCVMALLLVSPRVTQAGELARQLQTQQGVKVVASLKVDAVVPSGGAAAVLLLGAESAAPPGPSVEEAARALAGFRVGVLVSVGRALGVEDAKQVPDSVQVVTVPSELAAFELLVQVRARALGVALFLSLYLSIALPCARPCSTVRLADLLLAL